MITAAQMRAARALLGIDQRELAERASLSLPTIQRMEASDGVVRGTVESLMKLIAALDRLGVQLINEGAKSDGGGRHAPEAREVAAVAALEILLWCVAALLATGIAAVGLARSRAGSGLVYGA